MFEFLYKAQDGMSYDFIFYSYSISVMICAILYGLEFCEIEAVKGFWIVFAPFLPCWVWVYAMRSMSQKQASLKNKVD
jgi:hypothetical protein